MSKLKRLIKQLSQEEYKIIHHSLVQSEAIKSAELLEYFKKGELKDVQIKEKLAVNNNAFYTLRSRLNEKIESFFLEQMESPRTTLLKQVASINEIILTKNRTIAVATLKKLEKELADYDLSNELTLVYKALKKLHINSPEFFEYSQLYNRHVAYMLAVDKAEDRLAEYFKKYNEQLMNYDKSQSFVLDFIKEELLNTKNMNESHRLGVYYALCELFHNIMCNDDFDLIENKKAIFDTFEDTEKVLGTYRLDPTYFNLKWVFKYLRMLYFYKTGAFNQVDEEIQDLNPVMNLLLNNFSLYTAPSHFLWIKLERYRANGYLNRLKQENTKLLKKIDLYNSEKKNYITVSTYIALGHYFLGEFEKAVKQLELLLKEVNLKNHIKIYIDLKLLQALFYLKLEDEENSSSALNNVQRQIRLTEKENCFHSYAFFKVIRSYLTNIDEGKRVRKIESAIKQFNEAEMPLTSPLRVIDISIFDPVYSEIPRFLEVEG